MERYAQCSELLAGFGGRSWAARSHGGGMNGWD
jgi:hypothetical protein